MNKTWESLFQHLVGQVTKDTMDMNAMKKENENVLKDMQRLSASWEKQLEHLSKEQNASKQALMTISSLRANMESCNHGIACLVDEIESQRVSHCTLQEQKVSLDLSMKELREDVCNQADAALQVQKNVMSERTKQIIDETDNKIQDVISSYAREFAKTQEDSQEVWKAITTLKDVTKGFEQTMQSHRAAAKKDLEDCKYEARGLRLQLRATRETAIHSENYKGQNHHEPLL
jgi:chromosome segregation ATPase